MITLIGYGTIGKVYARVFKKLGLEFNVCDNTATDSCIHYKSYRDLEILKSDIIVIATPPNNHFELIKYFLSHDRLVVCEKPAVISETELKDLQHLKNFNSNLYLAYHTKFNSTYRNALYLLRNRQIRSIKVEYKENVLDYHTLNSWIFNKKISGGGCLIDSGINILSIILDLVDNINLNKFLVNAGINGVEDMVNIEATYDNKTNIVISQDWHNCDEIRCFTCTLDSEDVLKFDLATSQIKLNGKIIKEGLNLHVDHDDEYLNLVNDFLMYFKSQIGQRNAITKQIKPLEIIFSIYNNYA